MLALILLVACSGDGKSTDATTTDDSGETETVAAEPTWEAVQNLFEAECVSCHPATNSIDLVADIHRLVTPGSPENSKLWEALLGESISTMMPPTGPLPAEDVAFVKEWIELGAPGLTATVLGEDADLPASALLSVWGTSASDVWMVGADDGSGPVLIHFDGTSWERIDTGTSGDLWWVWGDGEDTLFLAGAGGRVVEHSISGGTFTEHQAADPNLTLFGLWGTSATDVWTVGGNVDSLVNGAMMHYDGTDWAVMGEPEGETFRSAFKVWGTASDDVWVVGTGALITHWDGTAFTEVASSPVYETTTLTTVTGWGSDVYAVGGFGNATVAAYDGSSWSDDSPPPASVAPGFNGVDAEGTRVVACGAYGSIWDRSPDGGWVETAAPATTYDLHGCWIDPDGHVWAVGGDLISLTAGSVVTTRTDIPPMEL